ncbi:MAG: hypothetical protein RIE06_28595 [Roseibium album]|uniref:Uncharacterized protein n=1 Tax=Roseibium album TaxID=311410 RepID=A0A0M7AKM5_9HYPH|nr:MULTISPECIES: hypothetical protein [Stappiaceae]MBG6142919.1 hypothetical protein [Labrenzia sp. EL_142]MBG6158047.1 hypothetical protein [Labrenzia sp. EL_162]MBG6165051.1 hypothetical protein [Labrenzia sp. EL_195]MBG6172604.1 hypothetical protein [Labrenzia sp. EL_132]MBG6196941.1 hypothetical protein [Labrenzia sp. EL_159]MBG6227177.1 hypothetical protein [Labrenzia sp. EL_208]MCR9060364.1 hypothetical protein [Paracoccaceae bacterium]
MDRQFRTRTQVSRRFKATCRSFLVAVAAIGLAACQQQFQTPSDLLFAPTFNKTRQNLPYTQNTQYDCRNFSGTGWKGIASGVVYDFSNRYQISQAGCFKTQQECQAWLSVMRSYIDVPRFIRCNPHTA